MAHPIFFKELPWVVKIQGKPELVGFSLGVSKPVDPESGMTLNLSQIMDWQNHWLQESSERDFTSWFEFLELSQNFFAPLVVSAGGNLQALQVRFFAGALLRKEAKGFRWSWQQVVVDLLRVVKEEEEVCSLEKI
jgi:hypothetical protein